MTVGSLQVTCSKLGISLRRPRLDNGIRLLPRGKPVPSNGRTTPDLSCDVSVPLQPIAERSRQDSQPGPPEQTRYTTPHQGRPKAKEVDFANLTLTMHYKGEERTTKLALTQLAIGQLALEAGLRDMRIGEFISELVTGTIQKNFFNGCSIFRDARGCRRRLWASSALPQRSISWVSGSHPIGLLSSTASSSSKNQPTR